MHTQPANITTYRSTWPTLAYRRFAETIVGGLGTLDTTDDTFNVAYADGHMALVRDFVSKEFIERPPTKGSIWRYAHVMDVIAVESIIHSRTQQWRGKKSSFWGELAMCNTLNKKRRLRTVICSKMYAFNINTLTHTRGRARTCTQKIRYQSPIKRSNKFGDHDH